VTEVEFFDLIVVPTVEDFLRNPGNIRLGVLSCIALQAMNEHYYHANKSNLSGKSKSQFKKELRDRDFAFRQVMDIANGTKHVVLDSGENAGKSPINDLHLEVPAECGIARCGFPLSSEPYVFVDDENKWLLCQLAEHVLRKWKETLGI
jgi:hypothetical protein